MTGGSPYDRRLAAALVAAAALSLVLLLWHHAEWRRSLEAQVSALDDITQARRHLGRGYFALERYLDGDPSIDRSEPLARLDRALRDWLEGHTGLLYIDRPPAAGERLRGRIVELREGLGEFRRAIAATLAAPDSARAAVTVANRARFSALDRRGDELELMVYEEIREMGARQERRLVAIVAVWLAFLGALALTATRMTRARRRAAAELAESEGRLRQLAENVEEVFWISDLDVERVIYVSPSYERVWGRPAAELLADPWRIAEAIHPEDRGRVLDRLRERQVVGTWNETFRIFRPSGETRLVRARAFPIRDEHGRVYRIVGVTRDVTREAESQERRVALERQLREAQKMEALGTLAGGIAHDFNNVLAAIAASAELARLEIEEDGDRGRAEAGRALGQVLAAAQRAKELTRRILTFSRQREQRRTAVALDQVAEEVCTLLRSTVPTTIEIRSELVHGAPVAAWADASQVYQVVMNLCVNAAHAMRERGGVLRVEVAPAEAHALPPAPTVAAGPAAEAPPGMGFVRLRVSDTGQGMDAETAARIFEPFFTTKAPGEGTGLGLSVVHGIVTAHGGAIDVRSTPGEGTRFDVYWPRADGLGAELAAHRAEALTRGNGERILLVDDEAWIVSATRRLFERLGYRVEGTTDSADALERFRREPESFALVLTDQTMPQLTGLELAAAVRAIRADVPVILMTGFSAQITEAGAAAAGIRAVVTKPFTLAEISAAVRDAMG